MTKQKPTVGLKVALAGYNATTAPDYDLAFSSNWPMLQVAKTFNHVITSADESTADPAISGTPQIATVTFYHNLGFYAFADVWIYGSDSNYSNSVAYRLNSEGNSQIYFGKNSIKVPVAQIESGTSYPIIPVGDTISIKVYSFDYSTAFTYASITPPVGKSTYDPHVGIKIKRPRRDINSTDLRNFIFHSKGSAPQILTVRTQQNSAFFTPSGSNRPEFTYQIPFGIPARVDFLYSTDTNAWQGDITGVYETSTGLAYWLNVFGQYDTTTVGDVTYSMSSTGLFTGIGLLTTVPFSLIVRRDPLLYSAPTVITL